MSMLQVLRIRNFAVIRELEVELTPGLNVFTGETGAGKSLLFAALELALGGRASSDLIRTGEREASVEAIFTPPRGDRWKALFERLGLPQEETLFIRRLISAEGRGRVYINGALSTLGALTDLGDMLVDIHGQHQHQSLLNPAHHLLLLDASGGLEGLRREAEETLSLLRKAEEELLDLERRERERKERGELLRFQIGELERAALRPAEEEELRRELELGRNAERLRALSGGALHKLYAGEGSAIDTLGEALKAMEELAKLDESLRGLLEQGRSSSVELKEIALALRDYSETRETDPRRMEELEGRLEELSRLKRKYGGTVDECLRYSERAGRELEELQSGEERALELKGQIEGLKERASRLCLKLSEERSRSASALEGKVVRELRELGMPGVLFQVHLSHEADPEGFIICRGERVKAFSYGIERGEFLISPNPGEELRPLARIASGGELSRIMLALKGILVEQDEIPTLVFDEVDVGIGGRVAEVVGRRLRAIASSHQVICITHLPQIASLASSHYLISKRTLRGRTETAIEHLDVEGRVEELARMAAGREVTDTARQHAREMLGLKP